MSNELRDAIKLVARLASEAAYSVHGTLSMHGETEGARLAMCLGDAEDALRRAGRMRERHVKALAYERLPSADALDLGHPSMQVRYFIKRYCPDHEPERRPDRSVLHRGYWHASPWSLDIPGSFSWCYSWRDGDARHVWASARHLATISFAEGDVHVCVYREARDFWRDIDAAEVFYGARLQASGSIESDRARWRFPVRFRKEAAR